MGYVSSPVLSESKLGSVDMPCHSERKRRTVFVDFVKDADFVKSEESQAFVRYCLSFCTARWQGK